MVAVAVAWAASVVVVVVVGATLDAHVNGGLVEEHLDDELMQEAGEGVRGRAYEARDVVGERDLIGLVEVEGALDELNGERAQLVAERVHGRAQELDELLPQLAAAVAAAQPPLAALVAHDGDEQLDEDGLDELLAAGAKWWLMLRLLPALLCRRRCCVVGLQEQSGHVVGEEARELGEERRRDERVDDALALHHIAERVEERDGPAALLLLLLVDCLACLRMLGK